MSTRKVEVAAIMRAVQQSYDDAVEDRDKHLARTGREPSMDIEHVAWHILMGRLSVVLDPEIAVTERGDRLFKSRWWEQVPVGAKIARRLERAKLAT